MRECKADLVVVSAHKMHGPPGVGALCIRDRHRVAPLLLGGGQEFGARPGTENLLGIVGFGKAAELAVRDRVARTGFVTDLRDMFWHQLLSEFEECKLNGHPSDRLPGNLSITVSGLEAHLLQRSLRDKVAFTRSSACQSTSGLASHVLLAIGLSSLEANSTFRICLSETNSKDDVIAAATTVGQQLKTLRGRR